MERATKAKGVKLAEEANRVASTGKKGYKSNFSKHGGKSKGPPSWGSAFHVDGVEFFTTSEREATMDSKELLASEGLVDTGATATAGGQAAVERLCAAVVAARPDARIIVQEHERPYFRYGSGKWGRALYKVEVVCGSTFFGMFALPSEGVPVLTGVRELKAMDAFLGCSSGRCLIGRRMVQLRSTPKGHLVMDVVKHVLQDEAPGLSKQAASHTPTAAGTTTSRASTSTTATRTTAWTKPTYRWVPKAKPKTAVAPPKSVTFSQPLAKQYGYVLELQCESEAALVSEHGCCNRHAVDWRDGCAQQSRFLGLSEDEVRFVRFGSSSMSNSDSSNNPEPSSFQHGQRQQGDVPGACRGDPRHSAPDHLGRDAAPAAKGKGQGPWFPRHHGVRHYANPRSRRERPPEQDDRLAMLRESRCDNRSQPLRKMARVQPLRSSPRLHAGKGLAWGVHEDQSSAECGGGARTTSYPRIHAERPHGQASEEHGRNYTQRKVADPRQAEGHSEEPGPEQRDGPGRRQGEGAAQAQGPGQRGDDDYRRRERRGRRLPEGGAPGWGGQPRQAEAEVGHNGGHGPEMGQTEAGEPGEDVCWIEDEEPLPESKAEGLLRSTEEFDLAAILGALQPLTAWEVSCRTEHNFGSACAHRGLDVQSKTLGTGYDLNKREHVNRLLRECWEQPPWKIWFSPACVMPSLLDQRSPDYDAALRKKRQKSKRQIEHFVEIATAYFDAATGKARVYLEIPTEATGTLRSPGVQAGASPFASSTLSSTMTRCFTRG